MRIIQPDAIKALVSQHLKTPSDLIDKLEGLAEFSRHVASFECPVSEKHLVGTVAKYLLDQVPVSQAAEAFGSCRDKAETLVSGLLNHGDLIEVEEPESGSRLLALRAPAACALSRSKILLLGLVPRGSDSLPVRYRSTLEFKGYARTLTVESSTTVLNDLRQIGYVIISETEWGQLPEQLNARIFVSSYASRFKADTSVGRIEGLRILDSERPVTHYKSRWVGRLERDGDYVARRQKRYGNDAWSFVRLNNLQPTSLLDFPSRNFPFRACDEAWHLQQAIDHEAGRPQRYRIYSGMDGRVDLGLFSPIPQWAHRRLASLGEQVDREGCLLAYRFPSAEVVQSEINFVETRMWLAPL